MNEMKKNQQAAKKLIIAAEKAHKSMVELVEANEDRHNSLLDGKKKEGNILRLMGNSQPPKNPVKRRSYFGEKHWKKDLKDCSSMQSVSKMVDNLRSHYVKRNKGVRKSE